MDIRSERHNQALIIYLTGSLDALTSDQAQGYIATQFEGGQRQVLLDLSQVDFMSSSGVRAVLEMLKKGRRMGGDLRVAAAQAGVEHTLELSGMLRVLKAYPSVEEGVRSFESR